MLRIVFAILFCVVSYLLLSPSEKLPTVEVSDKTAHVLVFFALTLNGGLAFGRSRYILIAICLIAYGILVELIQPLSNRNASIYDVIANVSGVALALLFLYLLDKHLWKVLNYMKIKA